MNTTTMKQRGWAVLCMMLVSIVTVLAATATPASAQDEFPVEVCAQFGTLSATGGPVAGDAAQALLDAPGATLPTTVATALNTIVQLSDDSGTPPTDAEVEDAIQVIDDWYGDGCSAVDACPQIQLAVGGGSDAAENAALVRGLLAPNPPGIDAALALVAGDVSSSPFHANEAEAIDQLKSYFAACLGGAATPVGDDIYATCAAYGAILGSGGSFAVDGANALRDLGSPNPPGVEDALDVIIDFNDGGTDPLNEEVEAANDILIGYFGDVCDGLNVCPLISDIVALGARTALAAEWARGIEAPAPPGIDAAFALLAQQIDLNEQEFYTSEADAASQIRSYYGRCALAVTGPSNAVALTTAALLLIFGGAVVMAGRRTWFGSE